MKSVRKKEKKRNETSANINRFPIEKKERTSDIGDKAILILLL